MLDRFGLSLWHFCRQNWVEMYQKLHIPKSQFHFIQQDWVLSGFGTEIVCWKLACLVLQCLPSLKCSRPSNRSWRIAEISSQWAPLWRHLKKIEKKTVSKKKKNSGAHYQQIWEIPESRIDGQGERFTHSKNCSIVGLLRLLCTKTCGTQEVC